MVLVDSQAILVAVFLVTQDLVVYQDILAQLDNLVQVDILDFLESAVTLVAEYQDIAATQE